MKKGPATPNEEAELLSLLHAIGWTEWTDENTRSRCLQWLRVREASIQRALLSKYEAGRQTGLRSARKRGGAQRPS